MNKIICALILTVLAGCASIKEAICDKPVIPEARVVHVDKELLQPCKPLLQMTTSNPSFEDYLLLTGDNAIIYSDCKKRLESSNSLIKEMANIK